MAGAPGQTTDPLIQRLTADPFAFDFFHAVRLLENRFADHPRFGYSLRPQQDPVRFAQAPFLDFAPATLEGFQPGPAGRVSRLFSRHFGLFGPNGPLPLCLTEYAHQRILHHGDRTFVEFCNVFHHRLISFFYRAWADAQKVVDLDRPTEQRGVYHVGSLIGLGLASVQQRDEVPDSAKLYYAGRLAPQTRNARGLEAIVQDFFGIPTALEPFVGRWLNLPPDSQCRLGASPDTGQLGVNTIVGSRYWDCQLTFRLRLGPMRLADYERLLPGGTGFRRLRDWVRFYCHEHFFWEVQFVLCKEEVPSTCLGAAGRLGWTTWLKSQPTPRDADDLVLQGA